MAVEAHRVQLVMAGAVRLAVAFRLGPHAVVALVAVPDAGPQPATLEPAANDAGPE